MWPPAVATAPQHHRQPRVEAGSRPPSGGGATAGGNRLLPNDVQLGDGTDLVVLDYNASGKSCYLRQIGLIRLMAQIGGWCQPDPPQSASPIRSSPVGAVDDLAAGQSTFMVEMAKPPTSSTMTIIPWCYSMRSDGTATFDSLSIAWAVVNPVGDRAAAPYSPPIIWLNLAVNATTWPTSGCWWRKPVRIWCSSTRCKPEGPAAVTVSKRHG